MASVRDCVVTQFVHLADSSKIGRITKAGISVSRTRIDGVKGFYCTPVCRDYYRTHQWLRELKRTGVKSIHAVQFQIDPDALVWVGQYNGEHIKVRAAEAARIFQEHTSGLGLEVVIPARLHKSSIKRVYMPSQVIGWRFSPESKGKKPFCGCKFCNRGEINAYRFITEGKE
jgi:hypothetical protein